MKKKEESTKPPKELSAKEEWFCRELICDHAENATRAYMKVYPNCTYDSAKTNAWRMLTNADIQARIKELREDRLKRLEISADRVLAEIAKLAFYDPRGFFDADGRLKPIDELDPDHAAVIAGIETKHEIIGDGEDGICVFTKIKLPDKLSALEKLGKNLLLWKDVGSKDNPSVGTVQFGFNLHPPEKK